MRLIVLISLVFALSGPLAAQERAQISVTGTGRVEAAPDMATLTLGVIHQAKTAAAAMDQVSGDVAAVLAQLAAAGIEGRDIQT